MRIFYFQVIYRKNKNEEQSYRNNIPFVNKIKLFN